MSDVEIEIVSASLRLGRAQILDSVDLIAAPGSVVGVVGPNGSGKSSTLGLVTGARRPSSGVVSVGGFAAGSLAARQLVGVVPDDPGGVGSLTVREFVSLVGSLWSNPDGFDDRAAWALEVFGLAARCSQLMGSLSNGQRRLVTFVAVFALSPSVWVIDEATAALDPEAVIVIRRIVAAAARDGAAVLLATQDLSFAESVCDEVMLLQEGRVVASGAPEALAEEYSTASLEETFVAATVGFDRFEEVSRVLGAH